MTDSKPNTVSTDTSNSGSVIEPSSITNSYATTPNRTEPQDEMTESLDPSLQGQTTQQTQAKFSTDSSNSSTPTVAVTDLNAMTRTWAKVENLAQSMLLEQKRKYRWNLFFRFSWLILVGIFIWLSFSSDPASSTSSGPHTAVVQIKGEIADGVDASALHVVEALKSALEDPSTKAVVLLINSPGGSPVQAGIINDEIYRLKALYKKPVYSVVEETCASAAYYIASATDKIYVDKASIVGSIGVLMDGFGFTGLMGKLGVERRLITAGENKGMLDPFSPQDPKQKKMAEEMLAQIHQQFIAVVKKGRGDRLKETPETFSGLFWTGEQAVQMGLADQLGNIDYVAREVVKAKDIVDYTRKENVAERLAKRFGASIGEGVVQAMGAKNRELR